MLKHIRNAFISGILLLLPLAATVLVVRFIVAEIGDPSSKVLFWFLDPVTKNKPVINYLLDVAAVAIVIGVITVLGYLSNYFLGRYFMGLTERVITSVPFLKTVYLTVKQIADTFKHQKNAVFQKVVLIEYPRKGIYGIGFITGEARGETQDKTGKVCLNIFVPTTPNPTSGYLLLVPKEDVVELEMSVPDGMKLIISGGAVTPKTLNIVEDKEAGEA